MVIKRTEEPYHVLAVQGRHSPAFLARRSGRRGGVPLLKRPCSNTKRGLTGGSGRHIIGERERP
jgi:hypothetical protein